MTITNKNPHTESETPYLFDNHYPAAPMGKRVLAFIIDSLIGGLVLTLLAGGMLVSLFLMMSYQFPEFLRNAPDYVGYLWITGTMISFFWFCLYSIARDALPGGQSWGKRLFGLMVVNVQKETPCSILDSLIRNSIGFVTILCAVFIPYCGFLFLFVEPVAVLAKPARLRLADRWSHTKVIESTLFSKNDRM